MEELAPTGRAIGQRRMRAAHQMTVQVDTTATRPHFWWPLIFILLAAALLRGIFPTADPPWQSTVGIVWHDEGAWVHNARNMALFGAWVQDRWNPLYVAPVFTGLEYLSFATFGVGLWQARLVSELCGLLAVALLACGVRRMGGREAGLIAGALLATNYIGVMWDRAALLEASMVAFVVAAWYCYVRAQTQPLWGALAAACALLAFFTKAAAAFFIAAIGVEVVLLYLWPMPGTAQASRRTAVATAGGLAVCGALVLAFFVIPHWTDYQFYNWQMSVTRKPSYDARSLLNRVTWFPIVHDIFTRLWFLVVVSMVAVLGSLARWRALAPPERLLVMWVGLGAFELLVHDVANERRFIFFIPALAALTALVLGRDRRLLPTAILSTSRRSAVLVAPFVFYAAYIVVGALVRLTALYEPGPGVRRSAALALVCTILVYATWGKLTKFLAGRQWTARAGIAVAALVCAGQLVQFGQWAAGRTYKNYLAMVELGRILPPGTLVHGKLANGLSLENRIKPVFVGRGFGNYDDREHRDDVRYILTYVAPYVGYEGRVIRDVLDAYPNHTIIRTFDVAETTAHDQAALIYKFAETHGDRPEKLTGATVAPGSRSAPPESNTRAHN